MKKFRISIDSPMTNSNILVGRDVLSQTLATEIRKHSSVFAVIDETVFQLYYEKHLKQYLRDAVIYRYLARESRKTPRELFKILEWLYESHADRGSLLIAIGGVLIEPFVVYKKLRHIPFTQSYYLEQVKYFVLLCTPFVVVYFWTSWKESVKRSRGYCWIGKFEVIRKQKSFLACYLWLNPGKDNKVKVNRNLFYQVHEGDNVMIRRDAFGKIERVQRVKSIAMRLRRLSTGRK